MREPQGLRDEAFIVLYERQSVGLLRYFARRTYDPEAACDLTAETFAQAYRYRARFRGSTDAEAAAWLYGIARHQLSHFARRGRVEQRAIQKLGMVLPRFQDDDHQRILEIADLDALQVEVASQFHRLTPDQRDAVRLRIVDDLPYPTVAARLNITEPTARARVSRGLRALSTAVESSITQGAVT